MDVADDEDDDDDHFTIVLKFVVRICIELSPIFLEFCDIRLRASKGEEEEETSGDAFESARLTFKL